MRDLSPTHGIHSSGISLPPQPNPVPPSINASPRSYCKQPFCRCTSNRVTRLTIGRLRPEGRGWQGITGLHKYNSGCRDNLPINSPEYLDLKVSVCTLSSMRWKMLKKCSTPDFCTKSIEHLIFMHWDLEKYKHH